MTQNQIKRAEQVKRVNMTRVSYTKCRKLCKVVNEIDAAIIAVQDKLEMMFADDKNIPNDISATMAMLMEKLNSARYTADNLALAIKSNVKIS